MVQIVGNSHVSVFSRGCVRRDVPEELVAVHWVGALEIEHFFVDHPAAKKVRALFRAEPGWKLLMIGNHDLFQLLRRATREGLDAAMRHYLARYQEVFGEFAALDRFGWLVGVQQVDNARVPGFTPDAMLGISRDFIAELSTWCDAHGIPVINPLPRLVGSNGRPEARWLQADGLHLKPEASSFYFDAIASATRVVLETQHTRGLDFEAATEHESYCSLVVAELALPPARMTRHNFRARVLAFARERLAERGLEIELVAEEDFVGSGLFDSLDLVEIYTFATRELGVEIDFDVSLRELETVNKLCGYLEKRFPAATEEPLVFDDFVRSMRGEADTPATIEADERIARMGAARLTSLAEAVTTSGGGGVYGFPLYWMALAAHALGRKSEAERWLEAARDPRRPFPVPAARARYAGSEASSGQATSPAIPHSRAFNVLADARDGGLVRQLVRAYLAQFGPEDDVALHVFAEHNVDEVSRAILDEVATLGLDPDAIADVCVHALRPSAEHVAAADLCVGRGDVEALAYTHGRPWTGDVTSLWRR